MANGEKTYEMFWDCEYCGARKLLGVTHRFCPECGAPQNPQRRYFPPDHEKVAVQDHHYVGADVHCPACREPQSAAVKHCTNCGSPLAGGAAAHRQADQVVGPGGMVRAAGAAPAPQKKVSTGCIVAVVGALVAVIAVVAVALLWKKDAAVEVASHSWVREIPIERYDAVREKGACKSMPRGAKELRRTKAEPVCTTRKVDQGDGTFKEKKECSEPVEQCEYEVMKWQVARTLKETGTGLDSEPRWPEVRLGRTGTCRGCEREGTRSESYVVHFRDTKTNDEMTCSFSSRDKWASLEPGSRYKAQKRVLTGGLDCDSLQPEG